MKRLTYLSLLVFSTVILASSATLAQTPRKTPRPLATPLPTLSGAEIISRAGDYNDPQDTPVPATQPAQHTSTSTRLKQLNERVDRLETAKKPDADERQRRTLLNLDILTRAEQRSETLRKQLFEMIEKENSIKLRLDQIDFDSRPEIIEHAIQISGSMRPEEVRDARKKSLDAERANLEELLVQVQSTKTGITTSLERADAMVERLRTKLEKEIDDTYLNDEKPTDQPEQL